MAEQNVLETVARLVTAAEGDTLYRDVYLQRAAATLAPLVTEAQYDAALARREQLGRLLAQARAAVARQDWEDVRALGTRAEDLQGGLDAEAALMAAAETVYAAPAAMLDPFSAGLPPSKRWPDPNQARADVTAVLRALAADDPTGRALYDERQRALAALTLRAAPAAEAGAAAPSRAPVEQQALAALERGDPKALRALAESMLGPAQPARGTGAAAAAPRARLQVPPVLGEPLPAPAIERAGALGLERAEVTLASGAVATAITEFVERHALGASPAAYDRARDGVARVTLAAEEAAIPPEVAAVFAETISLFALHQYVNSAGLRYVPVPAPKEVVLVERHADGDDAATPLLDELGLERRRALARDVIETRLLKHGARIVGERLGLDPLAFRLVCIPPDLFVRLGRERGWGQRPEWTHLDGYQVLAGGRLRALVGGHVRFGGVFDLCSLGRDDARDNTVARFAVVRRARFDVRIG